MGEAYLEHIADDKQNYTITLENIPMLAYNVSFDGKIIDCNNNVLKNLGYKDKSELIGKSLIETIYAPSSQDKARNLIKKWKKEGKLNNEELQVITKDGKTLVVILNVETIFDNNGKPVHSLSTQILITERKKAQEESIEKEKLYRLLSEVTLDGFVVHDNGKIIELTPNFRMLFGYTYDEIIKKDGFSLVVPEQRDLLKKRISTGILTPYETFGLRKDGTTFSMEVIPVNMDYKGRQVRVTAVRDITEKNKIEEELRKQKDFLNTIYENSDIGIFVVKVDGIGKYTYEGLNKIQEKNFGFKREDVIGKTLRDLTYIFGKDTIDYLYSNYNKCVETKKTIQSQYEIPFKDGKKEWWISRITPVLDINGDVYRLIGGAINITKQKKAEEELENIFNLSPVMIGVFTPEGALLKVNPIWERILGYSIDEVLKMNWRDLVHPDDVEPTNKTVEAQLKGNPVANFINRYKCKDGTYKTLEWQASPAMDDVVYATARDITERKKSEEALKESEVKFRTYSKNSPDYILMCNNELEIEFTNRAFPGVNLNNIIGKPFHAFIEEKDRNRVRKTLKDAIGNNQKTTFEISYKSPKEETRYFETNAVPLVQDGKTKGLILNSRDITERKNKEINLRKQLMKFKVEDGNIYLVSDKERISKITIFNDLQKVGYQRYVISRNTEEQIKTWIKGPFEYRRLADIKTSYSLPPKIEMIKKYIQKIPKPSVTLIERLDYLITKNNFKKVLQLVQYLNEQAYLNNQIIILSLDKSTLKPVKLSQLEQETEKIEPQDKIKLPEDMIEILKFIYKYNIKGEKPAQVDIFKGTGLSKPTIGKKLRELTRYGYITTSIKGKRKQSEITEKTRNLFKQ